MKLLHWLRHEVYDAIHERLFSLTCLEGARILLKGLLVMLPLQIRTVVWAPDFFLTGHFNAYATIFLYGFDVVLLAAVFLFGLAYWRGEVSKPLQWSRPELALFLLVWILFAALSTLFAEVKVVSLFFSLQLGWLTVLFFLVVNQVLTRSEVLRFFLYGLMAQAGLALAQYWRQASVGLQVLGEPIIGAHILGVAKLNLDGIQLLRSYGTFLHPNILGGFMVFGMIAALYVYQKSLWKLVSTELLLVAALLVSFSRSAFLALIGAVLILLALLEKRVYIWWFAMGLSVLLFVVVLLGLENILLERLLFSPDPHAGIERLQYLQVSRNMLLDQPWGVGLGNFTLMMQAYIGANLAPWLMQPVHNAGLLILNEGGIFAGATFLALVVAIFYWLLKALPLHTGKDRLFGLVLMGLWCALVIVSLFDHYMVSSYVGLAWLFMYCGLVSVFLFKQR